MKSQDYEEVPLAGGGVSLAPPSLLGCQQSLSVGYSTLRLTSSSALGSCRTSLLFIPHLLPLPATTRNSVIPNREGIKLNGTLMGSAVVHNKQ
ncbi:hypothetical protein Pmani_038071 [Petrolisthes manimaculis]|uniref:Uncharacterized protein n=1 Tax=Petrolisthes manimaculis TaxID=1843537 RepID=A0AAE1TMP6_9EUCA|nr:hypothetical protein Pmani_038071 [Petrolisthes manimaculis]